MAKSLARTHRKILGLTSVAVLVVAPLVTLSGPANGASSSTGTVSTGTLSTGTLSTGTLSTGTLSTGTVSTSTVESWGDNSAGELGDGSLRPGSEPTTVQGLTGVQSFSAGNRFDLALMSNGTVEAWGANAFGQLGNGTTTYSVLPVQVEGLTGVTAVSAGGGHSLALLSNGTVMAWGDNEDGQLGDGSKTNSDIPVAVSSLSGVKAISAGSSHSMALLSNDTVDAWGYNGDGQLGDGSFKDSDLPIVVKGLSGITQIAAGGYYSLALANDGKIWSWGSGPASRTTEPALVKKVTDVVEISAGWFYALALQTNGTVDSWTLAGHEESVPITDVSSVAAGGQFGVALLNDGTVVAWGDSALGQVGPGGGDGTSPPVVVTGLSDVSAISAGANSSLALSTSTSGTSPKAPSAQPSIWQDVPSPDPGAPAPPKTSDTSFRDVSAATTTDAWAVGQESPGLTNQAIAAHWNGSSWTGATLPTISGDSTFESVIDLAPDNAWAVGDVTGNGPGSSTTLTEHWDGTEWSVVDSPDPATGVGSDNVLTAVTGLGQDVWAFGYSLEDGGSIESIFLHLVDGSWQVVAGPNAGLFIGSATEVSPSDIWVVGYDLGQPTFSVHWNGKSWKTVATPYLTDGRSSINVLTGVSAAGASDVWASGYEFNVNDENFRIPYVLHDTGSGWTLDKVPTLGGEGSLLSGVTALSPTDVWAVGQTQQNDGSILTLSEQFNGKPWSIRSSLDPGSLGPLVDDSLDGVTSGGPSNLLTVGAQETLGQCCLQTLSLDSTKG